MQRAIRESAGTRERGQRRPVHLRRARTRPADRLATTLSDVGNRGVPP